MEVSFWCFEHVSQQQPFFLLRKNAATLDLKKKQLKSKNSLHISIRKSHFKILYRQCLKSCNWELGRTPCSQVHRQGHI